MKFTALMVIVLITTTAQSQIWHYGLKTDINFSGINGNGMQSKWVTNFQGGAFAEYMLNKKWSIQPELLFTQSTVKRGDDFLKYYTTEGRYGSNEKVYLNYISIPVVAKYHINKIVSLHAGPQFSYLVYSNEDLIKSDRDAFKKYEVSFNAGIEASLAPITFYFRYNKGLNNINDIDDRYKWTSQHLQGGIAVRIR